jgi:2-oxoglutarate ferredoxin oxidoreductase subunit beta
MKPLDYLKTEMFPLFWCSGCGNGIALNAITHAMSELELTRQNTVIVTGIGCWGKVGDYVRTNSFHGTHGRALAFATGIKLANPTLNVIVLMGDGDGTTIGGNHLIHCARRNVDLTAVIVNNYNYGMTGGQYSGTTPRDTITSTSRLGHIEDGFDICALAEAAGARFIARSTAQNPLQIRNLFKQGVNKKGFALVEIIADCPTQFGRYNRMSEPVEMLKWLQGKSVTVAQAAKMTPEELEGKIVTGVLCDKPGEDYSTKYQRIVEKSMGEKKGEGA